MAKGVIEKIKCDKCGYENEPQRIFCHECGAKLDRSEYVQEVEDTRAREARDAPKRLDDMKKKMPFLTPQNVLAFGLGPFLLALAVQILMPMNPSPATGGEAEENASMEISSTVQAALDEGNPKTVSASEEVLSSFLQRRLKKKEAGTFWEKALNGGWVYVDDGQITLVTARDFVGAGYSVYFTVTYAVVKQDAKPDTLVLQNYYLGRLKLPASLGEKMVPGTFGDVARHLKLGPDQLERVQTLDFKTGQATLVVQ
jgi:hypothetical protein